MTRVADALSGINRLGLDTSPFIYLVERYPNILTRFGLCLSALMRERQKRLPLLSRSPKCLPCRCGQATPKQQRFIAHACYSVVM